MTSPIDGVVVEVFAQAGEAVEYGEEVAAVQADVTVETTGRPAMARRPTPAAGRPDAPGEATAWSAAS